MWEGCEVQEAGPRGRAGRHPVAAPSRHPVSCGTEGSIQERVISFCDVPRSTKELLGARIRKALEHVGSGVEDVEAACAEAGLPRTTIEVRNRTIVHTVWRKTTKETIDTTKERALATKEIQPSLMALLEGFSDVVQAIFRFFWSHREHSARNFGGLHLPAWRWPGSTSRRCEGQTRSSYSQTQTLVQGRSNPRTGQNAYPSRAER